MVSSLCIFSLFTNTRYKKYERDMRIIGHASMMNGDPNAELIQINSNWMQFCTHLYKWVSKMLKNLNSNEFVIQSQIRKHGLDWGLVGVLLRFQNELRSYHKHKMLKPDDCNGLDSDLYLNAIPKTIPNSRNQWFSQNRKRGIERGETNSKS